MIPTKYLPFSQSTNLFFIAAVLTLITVHHGNADKIEVLHVGSPARGTTAGARRLVKVDPSSAGQALFVLRPPQMELHQDGKAKGIISITTCSTFTGFDTVLYIFDSNPLNSKPSELKWIDKNDNDCGLQSTVQLNVSAKASFYVLLTGYRGSEGPYQIRVEQMDNENPAIPWGLDRIGQRFLPLDGRFSVTEAGQGVFIYVLDSGVRATHVEFLRSDASTRIVFGNDFVQRLDTVVDETGHGTHVAALAAGKSLGVARKATVVSVRVLDRTNSGLLSHLIEGLFWAMEDIHKKNNFPGVVVMSLSTSSSKTLNDAIAKVTSSGIVVVAAAGNEGEDSCLTSPASEKSALAVAASDQRDQRARISNWGECVSIYAPGESIVSAWHTGDSARKTISGTSSACPLVAGAIAILLEQNPSLKPSEVKELLKATSAVSVKEAKIVRGEQIITRISTDKERLGRLLYFRSIPVVLQEGRPPPGNMFLYVIFGLDPDNKKQGHCHIRKDNINRIRNIVLGLFGSKMKTAVALRMCCRGHMVEGCDTGELFSGDRIIIRVLTVDSHAHSAFESLFGFCNEKDGASRLSASIGMKISLVADPWVLDSRGFKYWAAPALLLTRKRGLSTTQVVLIVFFVTFSALCLLASVLCLIRRARGKRRQKEQANFENKAREYEIKKHSHADLRTHEDLIPTPFVGQGMRRVNSELQIGALESLSPSDILSTPTEFTPGQASTPKNTFSYSGEVSKAQLGSDRPRDLSSPANDGNPVGSLFTRLWTPRRDRSAAKSAGHGKSPFRGLPRILSFGPQRGAIVSPGMLSPAESDGDIQGICESPQQGKNSQNRLETPSDSQSAST